MHALNVAYDDVEDRPAWKKITLHRYLRAPPRHPAHRRGGPDVLRPEARRAGTAPGGELRPITGLVLTLWAAAHPDVLLIMLVVALVYLFPRRPFQVHRPGGHRAVLVWLAATSLSCSFLRCPASAATARPTGPWPRLSTLCCCTSSSQRRSHNLGTEWLRDLPRGRRKGSQTLAEQRLERGLLAPHAQAPEAFFEQMASASRETRAGLATTHPRNCRGSFVLGRPCTRPWMVSKAGTKTQIGRRRPIREDQASDSSTSSSPSVVSTASQGKPCSKIIGNGASRRGHGCRNSPQGFQALRRDPDERFYRTSGLVAR